jgi:hypothetical protein
MMLQLNGNALFLCGVQDYSQVEYLKDCHKKVFAFLLNNQTPLKEHLTM